MVARGAQTAGRALRLLQLAVNSGKPLSLTELGQAAELNKAATYRLLSPLVEYGFLTRERRSGGYVVGTGLLAIAAKVMSQVEIREVARPTMVRIAKGTSETVSLHVRHMRQRICVDVVEGTQPIRRVVPLGESLPLYTGPTGKAIMAWLSPHEAETIFDDAAAQGFAREPLETQLEQVRSQGYLCVVDDRVQGVGGLSVPVFGQLGVTGAVTVSGPAGRFGLDVMDNFAPMVRDECASISAALGYSGPLQVPTAAASA